MIFLYICPVLSKNRNQMEKIEIYSSKKKAFWLLIGSLIFVAIGILMSFYFENRIEQLIGLVTILFFGLGVIASIRSLAKNKLMLVVDSVGVNVAPEK